MENLKGYRVEFRTKMGGLKIWVIDVLAKNKTEARSIIESRWHDSGRKEHIFNIEASLTKSFDYECFHQVL